MISRYVGWEATRNTKARADGSDDTDSGGGWRRATRSHSDEWRAQEGGTDHGHCPAAFRRLRLYVVAREALLHGQSEAHFTSRARTGF